MKKILSEAEIQATLLQNLHGESSAYIGYLQSTVEDLKKTNENIGVEQEKTEMLITKLTKTVEGLKKLKYKNETLIKNLESILNS